MKNLKIFLMAATMLLTLNVNAASTLNTTDICTAALNGTFKLTINDVDHEIDTPFNLSTVPLKVQIMDAGSVVFECTVQEFLGVHSDGIDHRVHSDGIDHRVHSDGIDHRVHADGIDHRSRTIEISQGGVLLFEKQL